MKAVRSGYTDDTVDLFTFGHGTLTQDEIAQLAVRNSLQRVVDVRTVPKSRTHPWVWSERMAVWIPEQAQAEYVWQRELGGFRKPLPGSHNTALRNSAFRGYADYMETEPFRTALERLVNSLDSSKTAVMCSETLWWRCHRRLIADAATLLYGVNVTHLLPTGRPQPHVPTQGVRRVGDMLRYDGDAA